MRLLKPAGIAAVLLSFVLAGCGGLDMEKLEREVKKGVEEQTGAKIKSIDCPESRPLKEGDEFTCDIEDEDGNKAEVTVTQTDADGNVKWKLEGGSDSESDSESDSGDEESDSGDSGTTGSEETEGGKATSEGVVLDAQKLIDGIKSEVDSQLGVDLTQVECTSEAVPVGESTVCEGSSSDGKKVNIEVTVQDEDGNVSWTAELAS